MAYVIEYMLNRGHLASKHDTPYELLRNHFVPALSSKYGPEALANPLKLQNLFMQSYNRVAQIFAFNRRTNMHTGKKEAQGGLLPLYMKAKKENLRLTVKTMSSEDEEDTAASPVNIYKDVLTEDPVSSMTRHIVNKAPDYSPHCVSTICGGTGIPIQTIEKILPLIHQGAGHDIIHKLLSQMLKLTRTREIGDILDCTFPEKARRMVIDASDPMTRKMINDLLGALILKIKQANPGIDFSDYEGLGKVQRRQLIVLGLVHNMAQYALSLNPEALKQNIDVTRRRPV
jgi:hypothetical protein